MVRQSPESDFGRRAHDRGNLRGLTLLSYVSATLAILVEVADRMLNPSAPKDWSGYNVGVGAFYAIGTIDLLRSFLVPKR